jgi:O-antigen ligase
MAILTAGLFFSLSRGAWMGAFVGLLVILVMRRQFRLMFRSAFILIPLIALCWQMLPEQDRSYTTGLTQENWNIKMRYQSLYFAQACFHENPALGVGVGLRKEYDATNLFWLTLAETGVLGAIPFLWIHFSFIRMVWRTQKRLHRNETLYSVVALGGALVLSKFIHGMVDHYWSRGAIMIAWSSAGMATYGYLVMRHRVQLAKRERALRAALDAEPEQAELESSHAA